MNFYFDVKTDDGTIWKYKVTFTRSGDDTEADLYIWCHICNKWETDASYVVTRYHNDVDSQDIANRMAFSRVVEDFKDEYKSQIWDQWVSFNTKRNLLKRAKELKSKDRALYNYLTTQSTEAIVTLEAAPTIESVIDTLTNLSDSDLAEAALSLATDKRVATYVAGAIIINGALGKHTK